ncbi:MAG: hypothetical protein HUJ26_08975 [Planctomycetaceae bacterium]|nr:hypothetical protein [Planctomycetaceae bacterium]
MNTELDPTGNKPSFVAKLLRPKVMILAFLLFLILVSPLLIRGWFLRGVPNVPEPFDREPLLEYSVPDNENAYADYQSAKSLYVNASQALSELRDRINEDGWHLANDDIRQHLHDNEDALLAWKNGTEKDKALYIAAKDYSIAVLLEVTQELRELHRTAMLRCKELEAEGKPQEAWEWYRASIRASRHAGTHGGLMERLVGIALFQTTADPLQTWAAYPELTADDLRKAIEQLQSDWQLTEKISTSLQIEYLALDQAIKNYSEEGLVPMGESLPGTPGLLYILGEPELSRRVMSIYFRNQLKFCDLPVYERPRTVSRNDLYDDPRGFELGDGDHWDATGFETAFQRAILARLVLPATSQIQRALDREEAKYRTLLVMLAGQAYRRDHGEFPNTLDELVPDYLDAIPVDNYDGKPLKYRFDPEGPVVYSVFENGIDDGGLDWSHQHRTSARGPDDYGVQLKLFRPDPLRAEKP